MSLGERLKTLRGNLKMSREKLAAELGLTYWALTKYESGEREPDYKTLIAIADYFRVSLDYLLGRTEQVSGFVLEDVLKGLTEEAKTEVANFIEFMREKHKDK